MKGLLIKDFFCLKRQLTNYVFIIVGVVVISILFVLSCNFGNLHAGFADMVHSGESTEEDIVRIASLALLCFMLIPLACTGDITNLFMDDANASFYKVASSLPVSIGKRVAVRYIAGLLFIAVGLVVDMMMTVILSSLTDIISFEEFFGVIVSAASLMMMYISMLIFFMCLFGMAKGIYANVIPIIIGVGVYVLIHFDRLRDFIVGSDEDALWNLYNHTIDFIEYKSYILFFSAVIMLILSYGATVYLAKRKRGEY